MAAKMIMLALSVRLWLAKHDVLNNVCCTDFPQKLFENQNQPWYIQSHQDHSWWHESHPVWPEHTSSANHSVEYMQLRPVGFMSMIGKSWNDTTTPCCSTRTTCIKPGQKGRSLSWTRQLPYLNSCSTSHFLSHHILPFVWLVARIFWLEYQFINDSIFGDSMVAILDFRSCEFWVHFKCTSEYITLTNMELDTQISFLGSMIPMLPLFVISAIFDGGHNGFQVMWTMCAFFKCTSE